MLKKITRWGSAIGFLAMLIMTIANMFSKKFFKLSYSIVITLAIAFMLSDCILEEKNDDEKRNIKLLILLSVAFVLSLITLVMKIVK